MLSRLERLLEARGARACPPSTNGNRSARAPGSESVVGTVLRRLRSDDSLCLVPYHPEPPPDSPRCEFDKIYPPDQSKTAQTVLRVLRLTRVIRCCPVDNQTGSWGPRRLCGGKMKAGGRGEGLPRPRFGGEAPCTAPRGWGRMSDPIVPCSTEPSPKPGTGGLHPPADERTWAREETVDPSWEPRLDRTAVPVEACPRRTR